MRVRTNPIDPAYVYPCSRRDVREAFGDGLLDSAWFGLTPEFRFNSRATHLPKLSGFVPISISVNRENEATLYSYRVRRENNSTLLRSRLRELLRGEAREWTKRMVARTDAQVLGHEKLIVEVRGGLLLTHELRYLCGRGPPHGARLSALRKNPYRKSRFVSIRRVRPSSATE